jgi:two-component system response regulator HydG
MPGVDGMQVLAEVRQHRPELPILMLTARSELETAVRCMQLGAFDYIAKPLEHDRVRRAMDLALAAHSVEGPASTPSSQGLVGDSAAMHRLRREISTVSKSGITVFLSGESGTGKELVAKAIHAESDRRLGPLVALNCGAIPESLQESELFGHERGSFTGASNRRIGRFEQANGGTIFLDEVAELSPGSQVRLLRVLQERRLERVGGAQPVELDIRVVSATHHDLRELVAQGRFREDLYYRLAVFSIELPPLRERADDIAALAHHFVGKHASDVGGRVRGVSVQALSALSAYHWPGNVRELENIVHGSMVRAKGPRIELTDLPVRLVQSLSPRKEVVPHLSMRDMERVAITSALAACGGNVSAAAKRLQISRATMYRKLNEYGLRKSG